MNETARFRQLRIFRAPAQEHRVSHDLLVLMTSPCDHGSRCSRATAKTPPKGGVFVCRPRRTQAESGFRIVHFRVAVRTKELALTRLGDDQLPPQLASDLISSWNNFALGSQWWNSSAA
jgi:hypothetical protein